MNKIKQILPAILAALIISVAYVGCKKGEDDPFLSLRSRKARVAGEWKLSKLEGKSSDTFSGVTTSCTESFDGSNYTQTCGSGSPDIATGTWTFTFERDGTFKEHLEITEDGDKNVEDYEGTWTFLCGIGDKKNKEQIALTYTRISSEYTPSGGTFSSTLWTGKDRTYVVWDLKQLKSKEMIWHLNSSSSGTSYSSSRELTYTFTLE